MGWLKIQKLDVPEYLENGTYLFFETKKFLTCAKIGRFENVLFSSRGNH